MFCAHCGQELPGHAKFCSQCGVAVGVEPQPQEVRPLVKKEAPSTISHKPTEQAEPAKVAIKAAVDPKEKEMAELRMVIGDVLAFKRESPIINVGGYLTALMLCDEDKLRIYPAMQVCVPMGSDTRNLLRQMGYDTRCKECPKELISPTIDDVINELRTLHEQVYENPFTGWGITAPLVVGEEDICRSVKPSNDLSDLLDKITRVRNHGAWLTVCIKDYYVQFSASGSDEPVQMEAVSARNLKKVGDKTVLFSRLGYQLGEAEDAFNYIKKCDLSGEEILKEFQYIFEHIYGVAFKNWWVDFSCEFEFFGQQEQPEAKAPSMDLYEVVSNVRKGKWDYAIVGVGNYYVQFMGDESSIYIEALSHLDYPQMGDKSKDFRRLGYHSPKVEGNFSKDHEQVSDKELIAEIKYIFEEIYGVEFSGWYVDYSENIPYEGPKEETQTEEEPTPSGSVVGDHKVNGGGNEENDDVGCWPLLIAAFLIGLLYLLHRWLF